MYTINILLHVKTWDTVGSTGIRQLRLKFKLIHSSIKKGKYSHFDVKRLFTFYSSLLKQ